MHYYRDRMFRSDASAPHLHKVKSPGQSSLADRHQLCAHATRLHVSGGDYRRAEPVSCGLVGEQHNGCQLGG